MMDGSQIEIYPGLKGNKEMDLLQFINNHTIIRNIRNLPNYLFAEVIVDNPLELVRHLESKDCFVSEILWWHRMRIGQASPIGGGGPCDPRNPKDYYFAETFLSREFDSSTSMREYIEYIQSVHAQYPSFDLYPSFDILNK